MVDRSCISLYLCCLCFTWIVVYSPFWCAKLDKTGLGTVWWMQECLSCHVRCSGFGAKFCVSFNHFAMGKNHTTLNTKPENDRPDDAKKHNISRDQTDKTKTRKLHCLTTYNTLFITILFTRILPLKTTTRHHTSITVPCHTHLATHTSTQTTIHQSPFPFTLSTHHFH